MTRRLHGPTMVAFHCLRLMWWCALLAAACAMLAADDLKGANRDPWFLVVMGGASLGFWLLGFGWHGSGSRPGVFPQPGSAARAWIRGLLELVVPVVALVACIVLGWRMPASAVDRAPALWCRVPSEESGPDRPDQHGVACLGWSEVVLRTVAGASSDETRRFLQGSGEIGKFEGRPRLGRWRWCDPVDTTVAWQGSRLSSADIDVALKDATGCLSEVLRVERPEFVGWAGAAGGHSSAAASTDTLALPVLARGGATPVATLSADSYLVYQGMVPTFRESGIGSGLERAASTPPNIRRMFQQVERDRSTGTTGLWATLPPTTDVAATDPPAAAHASTLWLFLAFAAASAILVVGRHPR